MQQLFVSYLLILNCSSVYIMQKERLSAMLDEDPQLMERRTQIAKRLELYKSARDEIDAVAWK